MKGKSLKIIKIGGNVINNPEKLNAFLKLFAEINGAKLLVHGGGREATAVANALGVETIMFDGRRVTDGATLDVVTMVYAGLINKRIVSALQGLGCDALGMTGADGKAIVASRRPVVRIDYGYVGDVGEGGVNVRLFKALIDGGLTPVVSAITYDGCGGLLNTNADSVATALAKGLSKEYDVSLTFCFEKPGVMSDVEDDTSVIKEITRNNFDVLITDGRVSGGMLPKLENALEAIDFGVKSVIITNYQSIGISGSGTTIRR